MQPLKIFVGGQWQQGRGEELISYFPADGSVNARLYAANIDDVNDAVTRADTAWRAASWRGLLPHQRAQVLYRVSELIMLNYEELARLQTRDNGKTLTETRGLVASAAGTARYFAAACELMGGELPTQRIPDVMTLSVYEPLGVIAAITPWNSPIASEMQKIAPALAAGNAVVLKPAEATPLIALKLAELFEQAGLPAGLLSVLPGKGSVIGEALARHPLVRKISFTGGTQTGRHLAHIAADKLITTSLELGGKSPTIVFADADLDIAVRGVVYGIFSSAGQACIAGARLFVQQSIYHSFLDRLLAITQQLRIGHPECPTTQISPLINAAHRQLVADYVQLAKDEGGQVLCGGQVPPNPDLAQGFYYEPTIIAGLTNQARVCQEEIFGPVLVVLPFNDEEELIVQANDSVYGLAAGIWTRDAAKALRLANHLDVGTVWINTYKVFAISTPFGGYKESGIGREKSAESLKAYMQQKSIYLATQPSANTWSR